MKLTSKNIKRIHINGSNDLSSGSIRFELFKPLGTRKVSSTWLPQLLGVGGFQTKGDKLLEFWGLLKGDTFDKYYELRGEIAERLLVDMLRAKQYDVKRFSAKEYDFDLFKFDENDERKHTKLYKYFGGLPDIVYNNTKEDILLEVKSKDLDALDKIINTPPEYEIMQGKQLALLYGLDKVTMTYVLFSEKVVRKMYFAMPQDDEPFDLEASIVKFHTAMGKMEYGKDKDYFIVRRTYSIDKQELLSEMKKAYKYAEGFKQTLTVSMDDISKDVKSQIFALEREIG